MHVPVLLSESLDFLAIRAEGRYIDATCGLGGHTRAIAARLTTGSVAACDRDPESLEMARGQLAEFGPRIRFVRAKFSELTASLQAFLPADGLLADLGVSRYQLTEAERGFSLQNEGPLDMRMDRSQGISAAEIVNHFAEKALADLIFQLGEERRSRRISRAIVRARPIRSTKHLADLIEKAAPRTSRLHPATQTFMALRLAVNQEQDELDALLDAAPQLVRAGGRVVIISFMSLEDRKVKERFREWAQSKRARVLTKHVVRPADEETRVNPASRSARLRAVEMGEAE
jgi:16S rRNA (cytosine1402-N4)-methyltransferase